MRYGYLLLLLLLGGLRAHAQAPAWRPFRPGFVYCFSASGPTPPTAVHTLRVDSAYATPAGDSVYAFNRLLRPRPGTNPYPLLKSRNNLPGARLRWRPGTADYYLEADAEPALGGPAAPVALLLRPRAAVGSTWAASGQPALTATLTSRAADLGNPTDSVATITLSTGQVLRLSRLRGLLQGPPWLDLPASGPLPPAWQQVGTPQPGLGPYDPRILFALNAGDEVGYELAAPLFAALQCQHGYRLRRILSRQQTADSLIFTYSEQDRVTSTLAPSCIGPPVTTLYPVRRGRWAFSLRTGASPQWPFLGLLAGEYRPDAVAGSGALLVGRGYALQTGTSSCLAEPEMLPFLKVYPSSANASQYLPGLDFLAVGQTFGPTLGVGPVYALDAYENVLAYYRRGAVSCGEPANYGGLLPTRAALAAATATLAPNPATEAATLTLAAAAPAGATLALLDALGRRVWSAPVPAGQTALPLPLAAMPAGFYLVQLLMPGAPPITWKLDH